MAKRHDGGFVFKTYRPIVEDLETGELRPMTVEEYEESRKPIRKARLNNDGSAITPKSNSLFFRVYKTNWTDLVLNSQLSMSQLGTLVAIMAFADWGTNRLIHPESKVPLSISALSKLIKVDRKHLSDVLGVLEEKGLLVVVDMGNTSYILVNAHVLYFGKFMHNMDEHKEAFDDGLYKPVVKVAYREPEKN